jgi:hypothetical protein
MKTRIPSVLITFALACFALVQNTQAVSPAPDGGYPGGNTAEGQAALLSLTTGGFNTAVGFFSLRSNTTNSFNTAIGAGTLLVNTADANTAIGAAALLSNTTGFNNTANGFQALFSNTTGISNTAIGHGALQNNTGSGNTANGAFALLSNTTGIQNTANGADALFQNTTGSNNIALGTLAGQNLTTGDYNIDIGNLGVAGDAQTIRIGDDTHQGATFIAAIYGVAVSGLAVVMDSSDHLGTVGSSRRFKEEIKPMEQASEVLFALTPVTFRYKKEIDPAGISQFGLVAEEVEKVNPDLVVRDKEGKPYSVRYDAVNAMLLNEFLKEHRAFLKKQRKVEEQEKTIVELKSGMIALRATVKEQAAQIQKVSDQLEVRKPAPQVVNNP